MVAKENVGSSSDSALMTINAKCYRTKTEHDEWIVGSAATRHMIFVKDSLVKFCPISAAVDGGKHELHGMGVGDKKITSITDHGEQTLWLLNIYYVPSIQFNIFSVRDQVAMHGEDYFAKTVAVQSLEQCLQRRVVYLMQDSIVSETCIP